MGKESRCRVTGENGRRSKEKERGERLIKSDIIILHIAPMPPTEMLPSVGHCTLRVPTDVKNFPPP